MNKGEGAQKEEEQLSSEERRVVLVELRRVLGLAEPVEGLKFSLFSSLHRNISNLETRKKVYLDSSERRLCDTRPRLGIKLVRNVREEVRVHEIVHCGHGSIDEV